MIKPYSGSCDNVNVHVYDGIYVYMYTHTYILFSIRYAKLSQICCKLTI